MSNTQGATLLEESFRRLPGNGIGSEVRKSYSFGTGNLISLAPKCSVTFTGCAVFSSQ